MPYVDKLRTAFTNSSVNRIAIVDDGFDLPDCSDLDPLAIVKFKTTILEFIDEPEDDLEQTLEQLSHLVGIEPVKLVYELAQNDDLIANLWKAYKALSVECALKKILYDLFIPFVIDKNDKLMPLEVLITLIKSITGIDAVSFGSNAAAADMDGYDLIFLDFYLNAEATAYIGELDVVHDTAFIDGRRRSMDFLKGVVERFPTTIPLVMLISSVARADDIPDVRKHARMLASKINFMPKEQLHTNQSRAQHAILGLVQRRRESDALWDLIDSWKQSVASASDELVSLLFELDLPDYSYLQSYRLNEEKIPLANYLGWLFNGYLSSSVEKKLFESPAQKLTNKIALPLPLPGRIAPTKAIASLYSGVTTSAVRNSGEGFKPNAWAGDVFLKTSIFNKIYDTKHSPKSKFKEPMPDVVCVVTPSCDLVPGRKNNAKTVTLIGGSLIAIDGFAPPTNHFLLLNDKPFHVDWDPKWPVTVNLDQMNGVTALEKRYRWVTRVQEVYHAELQHLLFKDLGRVGVPVVPTMPICVDLRILVKQNGGQYKNILDRKAEENCVWTFRTKKGESAFCLREEIVWEIQTKVKELIALDDNKVNKKLVELACEELFIEKLQSPITMTGNIKQLDKTGVTIIQVNDVSQEVGDSQQSYFVLAVSPSSISPSAKAII